MKTMTSYLKKIALPAAMLLAMTPMFVPATVYAACPKGQQEISVPVDQGGTKCIPINETSAELEDNPIFFYLRNIIIFLSGGVGLLVVAGIIYGAFLYITARANAGQAQKGQETIINSVIGLLLYIFMFAFLQFLIPGGIFR